MSSPQGSTLYLKDVPLRVTWIHVQNALQSCGNVLDGAMVKDDTGLHTTCTWKVTANNAAEAEMMLAALDGTTVVVENFIWVLRVSSFPQPNIKHLPNALPIFVPRKTVLNLPTRMDRYREMRQYGRLASVLVNVDVGFSTRGDVLHFWEEAGANAALAQLRSVLDSPQPNIFDPENVYCAGFDSHVDLASLRKHFAQYGALVRCQLKRADENKAHAFIRFQSKEAALKAVLDRHESILGSNTVVRFHEPSSARFNQTDEVSSHTPDAGDGTHQSATVETAQRGNQKVSDSGGSPNGIIIAEGLDLNEEVHLSTTYSAEEPLCAEEESAREAQPTSASQSTQFHEEAVHVKHDRDERPSPPKDPQLASKESQDVHDRQKHQALQQEQDPHRQGALQRRETATLRRMDAGSALREAHVREDDIRRQRLQAARKLARATAAFEEARRLREAAERREAAAKRALDSAVIDLDRVDVAAEHGRLATREALTHLHVAQQEEFEAQVGFLPYDDAEPTLDLDDVVSDDPMHPVDQGGQGTPFKEPMSVETEVPRPSHDTSSDADRLAESIRKVEEMRQQEELDRQAKQAAAKEKEQKQANERARAAAAAQLRLAQEERERVIRETKEREDRDRLAREEEDRKREERERLERERVAQERAGELRRVQDLQQQQQRIKKWRKAHNRESDRCRARDRRLYTNTFWSPALALKRFQAVCNEFDTITFSEQQPLVFENVPWPVLHRPDSLNVSTIDWNAVEIFFRQFRAQLPLFAYKDLVEKTHRRFHPDRWSSRGILATVFDEGTREKIREAGNVVSQAITPIWRESKNP